jgi:hypothetical protein
MRLSFIGNQKAEGVSDLQLFYSYFWQWEGLTPQAGYRLFIAVQPFDDVVAGYTSRNGDDKR